MLPALGAVLTVSPQAISMPSSSFVLVTFTLTPVGGVVVATGGTGSSISMSGLPKGHYGILERAQREFCGGGCLEADADRQCKRYGVHVSPEPECSFGGKKRQRVPDDSNRAFDGDVERCQTARSSSDTDSWPELRSSGDPMRGHIAPVRRHQVNLLHE